jgi:hypothetical protein
MKEGGRRGESREKEKDRMKPTVEWIQSKGVIPCAL